MSQSLFTKEQIRGAYADVGCASDYVERRFVSELNILLHEKQVSVVKALMKQVRPKQTLEIAPGPGRLTRDVQSCGSLVCLEYNDAMIQVGRKVCKRVAWVRGDGFDLPFASEFDFVYSFRFIRHFHREDRERLYAGLRRVIKPGGYFVMDAVNERISKPLRESCPDAYPIYDKLYRPEELRRELSEAGLEPLEMVPVQKYYPWQYRSQVLLGPRANWANRLLIRTLERLPRADGLEWIVTCRCG